LWSLLGYVLGVAIFALPLGGLWMFLRGRRHRRIRFAGWAPWWYVGGQPDVPEELQHERRQR
jgi:hypothetical protein